MARIKTKIWGTARNASSSCSNDAFSRISIHESTFSMFAWNDESVLELLPPVLIFCFDDRCLMNSCGFFFSIKVTISKNTQPMEKMSAFSVSCTRDRGFAAAFVRLKPNLKPEKSVVGALAALFPCEPPLSEDPDERLLAVEAFRAAITGAGVWGLASKGLNRTCASGAP
jgi:hypothetical protein